MRISDIVLIIIQCFWGVSEFVIKHNMTATEKNADTKSYKLLYVITISGLILGVSAGWVLKFDNIFKLYNSSVFFPLVGAVFIALGLYIRLSAIATLKNYFTVNVAIKDDHKLITCGPYKYIRHPAYAGGLLSFIGCGVCYGNIVSFIIIFLPYLILILQRIRLEEKVLIGKFGQDYIEFQSKTKKLIPHIY